MNFLKFSKKTYFTYPCPRKLKEIVKLSLFEKEQPGKIKEIWQKYYEDKHNAMGMDITNQEMDLCIQK
jgi:ATP synthase F1 complex assembly factor 1